MCVCIYIFVYIHEIESQVRMFSRKSNLSGARVDRHANQNRECASRVCFQTAHKGSFAKTQGSFAETQGSFAETQGSFAEI